MTRSCVVCLILAGKCVIWSLCWSRADSNMIISMVTRWFSPYNVIWVKRMVKVEVVVVVVVVAVVLVEAVVVAVVVVGATTRAATRVTTADLGSQS